MKPRSSNVTVRSNIFVRANSDPKNDKKFLSQIRGRVAILKVLRRIAPDEDIRRAATKYLSKVQLAEVAWQSPCAICGAFPEGPVQSSTRVEVQFRCPRGTCREGRFIPRPILLEIDLIRNLTDAFGKTIPEILTLALQSVEHTGSDNPSVEQTKPRVNCRRVVVLLTRSQYYFLTDGDVESTLRAFLESRNVIR
jgi:hypothetical protein